MGTESHIQVFFETCRLSPSFLRTFEQECANAGLYPRPRQVEFNPDWDVTLSYEDEVVFVPLSSRFDVEIQDLLLSYLFAQDPLIHDDWCMTADIFMDEQGSVSELRLTPSRVHGRGHAYDEREVHVIQRLQYLSLLLHREFNDVLARTPPADSLPQFNERFKPKEVIFFPEDMFFGEKEDRSLAWCYFSESERFLERSFPLVGWRENTTLTWLTRPELRSLHGVRTPNWFARPPIEIRRPGFVYSPALDMFFLCPPVTPAGKLAYLPRCPLGTGEIPWAPDSAAPTPEQMDTARWLRDADSTQRQSKALEEVREGLFRARTVAAVEELLGPADEHLGGASIDEPDEDYVNIVDILVYRDKLPDALLIVRVYADSVSIPDVAPLVDQDRVPD